MQEKLREKERGHFILKSSVHDFNANRTAVIRRADGDELQGSQQNHVLVDSLSLRYDIPHLSVVFQEADSRPYIGGIRF